MGPWCAAEVDSRKGSCRHVSIVGSWKRACQAVGAVDDANVCHRADPGYEVDAIQEITPLGKGRDEAASVVRDLGCSVRAGTAGGTHRSRPFYTRKTGCVVLLVCRPVPMFVKQ